MVCAHFKLSKVLLADVYILVAALLFGVGFVAQREVMVDGLGPMTCNAIRFGLSAIFLILIRPWVPRSYTGHLLQGNAATGASTSGAVYADDCSAMAISSNSSGNPASIVMEEESRIHGAVTSASATSVGGTPSHHQHKHRYHLTSDIFEEDVTSQIDAAKMAKTDSYMIASQLLGPSVAAKFMGVQQTMLYWGVILGILNFLGSGFQQWGIAYTSASKVAFIAGFDLFLTPLFTLFMHSSPKHNSEPNAKTWVAVFVSLMGLFLISDASLTEHLDIGRGETLALISTVFWTLHILFTDVSTAYVESIDMMVVQFGVVAVLSTVAALVWEPQRVFWRHLALFMPWLIYLAITEGLGFLLLAMGQTYAPPTHTAIILSMEGVFATVADYLFLGEILTSSELVGCALMLTATMMAELDFGCLAELLAGAWTGSGTVAWLSSVCTSASAMNESITSSSSSGRDIESDQYAHSAGAGSPLKTYAGGGALRGRAHSYAGNSSISGGGGGGSLLDSLHSSIQSWGLGLFSSSSSGVGKAKTNDSGEDLPFLKSSRGSAHVKD